MKGAKRDGSRGNRHTRSIAALAIALAGHTVANAAAAGKLHEELASYDCTLGDRSDLDMSGLRLTFEDTFAKPSITLPTGTGPWFAPVHTDYGKAKFLPYREGGPFLFEDGLLKIRLSFRNGIWQTGIIQSVNPQGRGFHQKHGYFEMTAKLPAGHSNWPAFWLKSVNEYTERTEPRAEIDVIEAYGGNDKFSYHAAVHLWPPDIRTTMNAQYDKEWSKSCILKFKETLFDEQFHQYGTLIDDREIKIYYDRKHIITFPMLKELNNSLFLLIDLAYSEEEVRVGHDHSDMEIRHVGVWQR